jgi:hypothetical protein
LLVFEPKFGKLKLILLLDRHFSIFTWIEELLLGVIRMHLAHVNRIFFRFNVFKFCDVLLYLLIQIIFFSFKFFDSLSLLDLNDIFFLYLLINLVYFSLCHSKLHELLINSIKFLLRNHPIFADFRHQFKLLQFLRKLLLLKSNAFNLVLFVF